MRYLICDMGFRSATCECQENSKFRKGMNEVTIVNLLIFDSRPSHTTHIRFYNKPNHPYSILDQTIPPIFDSRPSHTTHIRFYIKPNHPNSILHQVKPSYIRTTAIKHQYHVFGALSTDSWGPAMTQVDRWLMSFP